MNAAFLGSLKGFVVPFSRALRCLFFHVFDAEYLALITE
jgi:hypothetical protein